MQGKTQIKSQKLKQIIFLGKNIQVRGLAMQIIQKNWEQIVWDLGYGLSANDVAIKYGFGRRSLFNFLKLLNISVEDIRNAVAEEKELKKKTRIEKLQLKQQRMKIVPNDYESLRNALPFWDKIKTKADRTKHTYLRCWLEMVRTINKHPTDITSEDLEKFYEIARLEYYEKHKKDLERFGTKHVESKFSSEYITPLRVFAQYMGLRFVEKTKEYESPYRSVRLTVKDRYEILRYIKVVYPNEYEWIRATLEAEYYNGHRAKELLNISFEEREHYVLVYAVGKRGIRYEKILPKYVYYDVKGKLPLNKYQLSKLRKILKEAYENVLDKNTITYYYAMKRPLHVWRHTACNDLIDYSNYNIGLIMAMLGWKNPKMIVNVYGEVTPDMVARQMGWISGERRKFEFLYNEWLEKAYKEGLISKEYYEAVKNKY